MVDWTIQGQIRINLLANCIPCFSRAIRVSTSWSCICIANAVDVAHADPEPGHDKKKSRLTRCKEKQHMPSKIGTQMKSKISKNHCRNHKTKEVNTPSDHGEHKKKWCTKEWAMWMKFKLICETKVFNIQTRTHRSPTVWAHLQTRQRMCLLKKKKKKKKKKKA